MTGIVTGTEALFNRPGWVAVPCVAILGGYAQAKGLRIGLLSWPATAEDAK
jgi:hypothetical protein